MQNSSRLPIGVELGEERIGRVSFHKHSLVRVDSNLEFVRVQHGSIRVEVVIFAIAHVAHHWMTQILQVNSQLVTTTCHGLQEHFASRFSLIRSVLEHFEQGSRFLRVQTIPSDLTARTDRSAT